jgi:hypothetical protein
MKNFAQLDENNVVVNIIIANDDFNSDGYTEYSESNPAFIGGDYVDGFFYSSQPYPSWTRNQGSWLSPVLYPTDGQTYEWNENNLNWDLLA